MKKRIILLFAMLATIVLLAVGLTVGASANTINVAAGGSLSSAISGASDGDVINITGDISVSSTINITKNVTITSSNESTISGSANPLFKIGTDASTSGALTISGDLKIINSSNIIVGICNGDVTIEGDPYLESPAYPISIGTDDYMKKSSTLTITGGTIRATTTAAKSAIWILGDSTVQATVSISGGSVWANGDQNMNAIVLAGGSLDISGTATIEGVCGIYLTNNTPKTLNISGGTLIGTNTTAGGAQNYAVFGHDKCKNATITITGGTFQCARRFGIALRASVSSKNDTFLSISGNANISSIYGVYVINASLTISGGTFNNEKWSVDVEGGGEATISGGTITAGLETIDVESNGSLTITGGTISATGSGKNAVSFVGGTLTISGGSISGTSGGINFTNTTAKTLNVETGAYIYGGTYGITTNGSNHTLNISGGTVIGGTSDIKDGVTVNSQTGGCAKIGNTWYTSVKSAVAAGGTVTIVEDTKLPVSVTVTGTVTLTSTSAKTITGLVANVLKVGSNASTPGNLTIEGSLTITSTEHDVVQMVNGTATVQGNAILTSPYATIRIAGDKGLVANSSVYIKGNAMIRATSGDESDNAITVNHKDWANLYIQGGTVSRPEGRGIAISAGNVYVSGGTLTAKYGIFAWYDADAGVKAITVNGGDVMGDISGIYVNTNTKNLTITVSGGFVSGNTHAIDYRSDKTSSNNSISIEGGVLTAPSQTIFLYRCTAVPMTITGGTVEATTGGLAIYGAELRGDVTLNISGNDTEITAQTSNTIQCTKPGDTSTYPGKFVATISKGLISAGTEHTINVQNSSYTIMGGTITAPGVTIYGNKSGGSISISGGIIRATGSNAVAFQSEASQTLNISGTARVEAAETHAIWFADQSGATVTIWGGTVTAASQTIFLNRSQAVTLTVSGGTIEATDGGNTIYGAEMRGDLTLNVSGSPSITATGESAVVVVPSSNYPGKLVATIGGGAFSASSNTFKIYSGSVTMTAGAISAVDTGAIHCHRDGGLIDISGGTVSAATQAIVFPDNSGAKTLNISGSAKITANSSTVFFYRTGAVNMTVTGGTIEAKTGGNTIYGAEMRGNLTLDISGSPSITAAQSETIVVTLPGNTSTYPGKLVATISGGTISAGTDKTINVQHGSVSISGGTISAPTVAIYAHKAGGQIEITGGTVTAGSNTIVLNEAGARTLTISGSAIIRATSGNGAITSNSAATPDITITGGAISASGDFCIDTKGGTVIISGGTLTAGGYCTYLRGTVSYAVSGGKLTAGTNSVFAVSSADGISLWITDGIFLLNGDSYGAKIIAEVGDSTNCEIEIEGGLFVCNNTGNHRVIDNFSDETNTLTLTSARILYHENVDTITGSIAAPKTAQAVYDLNGNGIANDGETFYFYAKFPATNSTYSGAMTTGASVRLGNNNNGIRFTSEYSSSVVTKLNAKGIVTYGTIILPTTFLIKVNSFTKAELDAAGISYRDIVATYDTANTNNGGKRPNNGGYTIRAALTDLSTSNYGLSFSAVSYALVNGTYYYTAYNTADNARTMQDIAQAALDDLSETSKTGYTNAVSVYGTTMYSPYSAAQRATLQSYIAVTVNTPLLAGKSLTMVRSGDDTYQYYNKSASLTDYNNYKSTLVSNGYTLFAEKTMDSNKFATYTGKGKVLTLSFTPATTTLRLLMEPESDTALPTTSAQNTGYSTGTTTKVTQVGLLYGDGNGTESHKSYYFNTTWGETRDYTTGKIAGMCYVIQLCDGSFIVIDGGYNTAVHAENLYNVMKKQAGSETFTIAAWIFTHVHDDHAGAFRAFTETKKYSDKVTIERFIYNFPSESAHLVYDETDTNSFRKNVIKDMNKYAGAKQTIGHAGQEFYIRNAKINILFAADLMEPHSLAYYNSNCMVFQIELESKKLLFFGDCGGNNSFGGSEMAYVNSIYSATTLKSDFVQATHHGLDPEKDSDNFSLTNFYKNKVQPTYVFFPVASEYVKEGDSYVILQQRNESYLWGRTKYIAKDDVIVVTLNNGSVSATTYADVATYIA